MKEKLENIQWWLAGIFFRRIIRESYADGWQNGLEYGRSLERSATAERLERKHLRAFSNKTLALGYDYAVGVVKNNITIKEQEEE